MKTMVLICFWLIYVSFSIPSLVHSATSASAAKFTDVTNEAGLGSFSHAESYSAAAADFNQDGYPDIAISRHGESTLTLLVNQRDGSFREASHLIEGAENTDNHGVSFIDINNDNLPDLVVSCGAERGRGQGENQFFLNNGGKKFTKAIVPAALRDPLGRGRSITPIDFNGDNFIDLLLTNFYQKGRPQRLAIAVPGPPLAFTDISVGSGLEDINSTGMEVVNLNNNSQMFIIANGGGMDAGSIYQKIGASFIDVTKQLGLANSHWVSVVPFDYDNDGDLDLLHLNRTFFRQSGVEVNHGEIDFLLKASPTNTPQGFSAPAKDGEIIADILFEGGRNHPDLLQLGRNKMPAKELPWKGTLIDPVLQEEPQLDPQKDKGGFLWRDSSGQLQFRFIGSHDNLKETSGIIRRKSSPFTNLEKINIPSPPTLLPNSLYLNDNGKFIEVTEATGISGNGLGCEAIAADFNNDGFEDIYQVNCGYNFSASNPPNSLFMNNGNGTFSEVASQAGATGPVAGVGTGVIALDYDKDGDLDLFLHNGLVTPPFGPGAFILLRNDTPHPGSNSLKLDFRGTTSNSRAWGVQIRSIVGKKILYQQKYGMNGFLSTSDLPLHLGLGEASLADEITVTWPSGKTQTLKNVPAGSNLTIKE